jgi:hypothetical protein
MCDVELTSDGVEINPSRWEHAGGMQGTFVVPLAGIAKVSTSDDPVSLVHGLKAGVGLPKTKIGQWRNDDGEDYFCIRDNGPAVVLDLKPEQKFNRVAVTVEDPSGLAAKLQAAVAAQAAPEQPDPSTS